MVVSDKAVAATSPRLGKRECPPSIRQPFMETAVPQNPPFMETAC